MKEKIKKAIDNSYSYQEYLNLIDDLIKNGKTSGENQSEILKEFTILNRQRMKRLDKTIKIDEISAEIFKNNARNQIWLVLTEAWCGDAGQILPVLNKISVETQKIDLKMVFRDENDYLMQELLTSGAKSIPKLVSVDKNSFEILFSWGPRPKTPTKMIEEYKKTHQTLSDEIKEELQKWYNENKGQEIIDELKQLV